MKRVTMNWMSSGSFSVCGYEVTGNEPLTLHYIDRQAPDRIAIAHYRALDGVMVPEPDMEIRVDHEQELPLTRSRVF